MNVYKVNKLRPTRIYQSKSEKDRKYQFIFPSLTQTTFKKESLAALPSLSFNKSQQRPVILQLTDAEEESDFDYQNLKAMLKAEIQLLGKFVN